MDNNKHLSELINKLKYIGKLENKKTGFCIGNTAKIEKNGVYFTPIRNMKLMVFTGVVVNSEEAAVKVARAVDGKVDYILVDSEKKIPNVIDSMPSRLANVERAVREVVVKSSFWVYKGNDLAVEAVNLLVTYLYKDILRGIGGGKIAILGAGNLGCKLALMLVEGGANVFVTRRDFKKMKIIVQSLNLIKPVYTTAQVVGSVNNEEAAQFANILIGATRGKPVITRRIVKNLAADAIIIEAGKGTFYPSALKEAHKNGIKIYRLDVSAAFEGLISRLFAIENTVKHRQGRCLFHEIPIVSGGLMGMAGEVVVDNINNPKVVYGIADGNGDFIRNLNGKYAKRLEMARKLIEKWL